MTTMCMRITQYAVHLPVITRPRKTLCRSSPSLLYPPASLIRDVQYHFIRQEVLRSVVFVGRFVRSLAFVRPNMSGLVA